MQRSGQIAAVAFLIATACGTTDDKGALAGNGGVAPSSGGASGGSGNAQGGATSGGAVLASGGSVFATGGTASSTGGTAASGSAGMSGAGGVATGGTAASGAAGSTTGGSSAGQTSSGGNAGASGGSAGDAGGGNGGDGGTAPAQRFVYASGYGSDISILTLDTSTGALKSVGSAPGGNSPSYLALAPNGRFLYAVNEASPSRVIAFSIDASSGKLTEINRQNTTGDGAPHLAVDPSGKWVTVAHYGSGHITVLPIQDNGGVGAASDTSRGPNDGCQKAHQAVFDRSGKFLFVPCLGSNYVIQFKFNAGKLSFNEPSTVAIPGGPRHLAFDPSEQHAYVISELESKLTSLQYDKATGLLSEAVTIPSVKQTVGSSGHVVVHPSGAFLYVSNRNENSIGLFSIDATSGRPTPVAFETSMIATPRDFTLDPSGQFLLSANQDGNQDLVVFRVAQSDGKLTHVGNLRVGGQPSFVGVRP